jgi:MYXO-CTERM domain-containing protein
LTDIRSRTGSLVTVAAALALPLLVPSTARAETWDWETGPDVQFRMWIDDGQPVVHGFLVIWNESTGDTRVLTERPSYQEFARTFGFGIIGTQLPDPGYADTLLEGMEAFAEMSGHPEVATAPVLCEGLSLGGYAAMEFAAAHPERTIAYLSGASGRLIDTGLTPAFRKVPGLFYLGEMDPDIDNALSRKAEVDALRADGAQVAYLVQWTSPECPAPACSGHARGFADELGWKFLADAVRLRYPVDVTPLAGPVALLDIPDELGWLADQESWEDEITRLFAFADAPADPRDAYWFPTRDTAFAYRGHATRDRPVSFTAPSAEVQWTTVEPGDPVPIAVTVDADGVARVDVFDGSQLIASIDAPPYETTWTAAGVGAHSLVAVATLDDGTERSGYIAPVMVLGSGLPGGGGLDTGEIPDAGVPSSGGQDAGPAGTDGGGGDGGAADGDDGCGCRTSGGGPGSGAALAVLLVAWLSSRRATRR